MTWRHVPLALRVAIVLQLAICAVHLAMGSALAHHAELVLRVFSATASLRYAVQVLLAVGAFDLTRQLTGHARRGAQIAFVATLLDLALAFVWAVVDMQGDGPDIPLVGFVLYYGSYAADLGLVVGFAVAAWRRRLGLAIAGVVVGAIIAQPPFLAARLYATLDLDITGRIQLRNALAALEIAVVLVLALAASTGQGAEEPQAAERGFRSASRALWLRVVAVGLVPMLTLLGAPGSSGDANRTLQRATVAGAVVGVASLTLFAVGVLGVARARLADMRALLLYASALGALACAGIAIQQTPLIYRQLAGDHGRDNNAAMWSVTGALVAIGALWCLTVAITRFATRRGLHDLRGHASGRGLGGCALVLASFLITVALPAADSEGAMIFLMLVSLACALAGAAMLAKLCAAGAEALRVVAALPTAKLV